MTQCEKKLWFYRPDSAEAAVANLLEDKYGSVTSPTTVTQIFKAIDKAGYKVIREPSS